MAALTARLPDAVESGIALIEKRAAQTSDCAEGTEVLRQQLLVGDRNPELLLDK